MRSAGRDRAAPACRFRSLPIRRTTSTVALSSFSAVMAAMARFADRWRGCARPNPRTGLFRSALCFARSSPAEADVDPSRPRSTIPWRDLFMSRVRVLVGTRKGAFVLTSDGKRDRWDVAGPHFGGWEIYHLKG